MTISLEKQLREDRAMRDEALALVKADYAHLKSDYSNKGIGARTSEKLKGGATDIYGEAIDMASAHKGMIAAFAAALVVWLARHPLGSLLFGNSDDHEQ